MKMGWGHPRIRDQFRAHFGKADGIGDKYNGRQHPGGYTGAIVRDHRVWSSAFWKSLRLIAKQRSLSSTHLETLGTPRFAQVRLSIRNKYIQVR